MIIIPGAFFQTIKYQNAKGQINSHSQRGRFIRSVVRDWYHLVAVVVCGDYSVVEYSTPNDLNWGDKQLP